MKKTLVKQDKEDIEWRKFFQVQQEIFETNFMKNLKIS